MTEVHRPDSLEDIHDLHYALSIVLEMARQVSDAHKPLYVAEIFASWDASFPLPPQLRHAHWLALQNVTHSFEKLGACRISGDRFFLPRRRQPHCPYHDDPCLPTRETPEHRQLALEALLKYRPVFQPTFLVDLLDPWPRGWPAPTKSAIRGRGKALPAALRYHIMQRDGFRCQLCGATASDGPEVSLTVDHKISRAHRGTDDPPNLWCICALCNQGKGTHDL